jgi:hypothetical protein
MICNGAQPWGHYTWPCQNTSPRPEVTGSTPVKSIKFFHTPTNGGVPRGTIPFSRKMPRVKLGFIQLSTTSAQSTCHYTYHVIVWSYSLYSHLPHHHCTDCMDYIIIKIFPVWKNEQNTIYFAYGVHLSPFKLHWVHNEETQTHIGFEAIMSTLIFRPSWTHFGFRIHVGSHLLTKTFWYSKRILTIHEVWDRPPHLLYVFKLYLVHLSYQDHL